MNLDSKEYWKKRLLKSFNKESYETEEHVDVNENRGEITVDEEFHLEWDNSSHLFWYEDSPGDSDMSLLSLTVSAAMDEFLDQYPVSISAPAAPAISPAHSLDRDSAPCTEISDCEQMSQRTLVVQKDGAMGECLGPYDGATETKQWIASTRYDANMENEIAAKVTTELSPILTVPFHDSLPHDMDGDHAEFEQVKVSLPKLKPCYSLFSLSAFNTEADPAKVAMVQCLQTEKVLGNNTGVSMSKCVLLPMVTSFMSATAMLGTGYCCAVHQSYQTSSTAVLLYEPEPLWLDLTTPVYTLDQVTAVLKLLYGHGLKLVMYSVMANTYIVLLYNEINSTYRYLKLQLYVMSLAFASLALLLMFYVANVMHGHTLLMSQHIKLLPIFFVMASFMSAIMSYAYDLMSSLFIILVTAQLLVTAATVNIFLLVYDKSRLTASYEYPKFHQGKMVELPSNADTSPLFTAACKLLQFGLYELDIVLTRRTLAYFCTTECTAASQLLQILLSDPCYFANRDQADLPLLLLLASYLYVDFTRLLLSTALFIKNNADMTATLAHQADSRLVLYCHTLEEMYKNVAECDGCSPPSSDTVSEAESLFVDLLTSPYMEVSLLLAFFHNYAALAPFQMRIDVFKASFIFGSHLAIIIKRDYTASYHFSSLLLFSLDPELNAYSKPDPDLPLHGYEHDPGDQAHDFPVAVLHELRMDLGPLGNQVDLTLLYHHEYEYLGPVPPNYVLYPVLKANKGVTLYSEHTAASKLLGPNLGTLTSRVQVMLLRAFPYVDVTTLASLHCSVRAH